MGHNHNSNDQLIAWAIGGVFILILVYNFGVYIVGFLAVVGAAYLGSIYNNKKPPRHPPDRWRR